MTGTETSYSVKLSQRGFDVHHPCGQIVYSAASRSAARMVAGALEAGRISDQQAVRLPSNTLSELSRVLEGQEERNAAALLRGDA